MLSVTRCILVEHKKSVPVLTLLCYILLFLYCCSQIFPNPCPLSLLKDKFLTATVTQAEESLPWPPPLCRLFFWLEFQKESLQCNEQNDCEYCFLKNLFPHTGQVIIEPTFDFLFWRYIEFLDLISMILLRLNSFLNFPFIQCLSELLIGLWTVCIVRTIRIRFGITRRVRSPLHPAHTCGMFVVDIYRRRNLLRRIKHS